MAEDLIISYANDIQVRPRHNHEVRVTLTKQGPAGVQGPKGDTGDVTQDALDALAAAKIAETNAKTSATNAKTSETSAAASKTAASTSATNAKASETNAAASASASLAAKTASESARDDAQASKIASAASATAAKTSETNAKTSETKAAASQTSAANSASDAIAARDAAKASETNAKTSETNAAAYAVDAKASRNGIEAFVADAETSAAVANAAKADAITAKIATETARTDAQNAASTAVAANTAAQSAKSDAEAAKTISETARDEAVASVSAIGTSVDDALTARNEAEGFALRAEAAAEETSIFDPASFMRKSNNGSDFADVNAARENIGAQIKLDTVSQAEATAGTEKIERNWTAERVKQAIDANIASKADLNSPDFAGIPTAPTAVVGTNTTQIATTAFVKAAVDELVGAAPGALDTLQELADAIGDDPNFATTVTNQIASKADLVHTHSVTDIDGLKAALDSKAPLASPALTGTPTAPTPTKGDSSTNLATTEFVSVAVADKADLAHTHAITDILELQPTLDSKANAAEVSEALSLKAPLDSPTLTGVPKAPTATKGTNTTQVATTAFVAAAVANLSGAEHEHEIADINGLKAALDGKAALSHEHAITDVTGLQTALNAKAALSHTHNMDDVAGLGAALDLKAPLASPALTGSPTAPTATSGTNNTQIATTAFVGAAVSKFGDELTIAGVDGLQTALDAKWETADLTLISQAEAESGSMTTARVWSAQRVRQAIDKAAFQINGSIAASVNLNDMLTPGLWHQGANANTSAALNYPVLLAGMLQVTAASNMVYQTYTAYSTGKIYSRVKYQTAWSSWVEMSVVGHTHAIADVSGLESALDDRLAKTGGLMAGPINFNGFGSGNSITVGNGDAATATAANLRLSSWYGIGFMNATSGQSVPQWENSHWFNVRNGDMGIRGTLTASGNLSAYSDARLKTDVETIDDALELVMKLRGVRYTKDGRRNIGVIAQEFQKHVPELVIEGDDDEKTLSVIYGNTVGLLIEAVKSLKGEVDELKRAA